jgi:hypothetical protein
MNLVLGEMEAVIEGVYMSEKVRGDFFWSIYQTNKRYNHFMNEYISGFYHDNR